MCTQAALIEFSGLKKIVSQYKEDMKLGGKGDGSSGGGLERGERGRDDRYIAYMDDIFKE